MPHEQTSSVQMRWYAVRSHSGRGRPHRVGPWLNLWQAPLGDVRLKVPRELPHQSPRNTFRGSAIHSRRLGSTRHVDRDDSVDDGPHAGTKLILNDVPHYELRLAHSRSLSHPLCAGSSHVGCNVSSDFVYGQLTGHQVSRFDRCLLASSVGCSAMIETDFTPNLRGGLSMEDFDLIKSLDDLLNPILTRRKRRPSNTRPKCRSSLRWSHSCRACRRKGRLGSIASIAFADGR